MTRRSPYRHPVRSYTREGHRVDKYMRGEGKKPARPKTPLSNTEYSEAQRINNQRALSARRIDERRRAPYALSLSEWKGQMNRTDLPGIDTPYGQTDVMGRKTVSLPDKAPMPTTRLGLESEYIRRKYWLNKSSPDYQLDSDYKRSVTDEGLIRRIQLLRQTTGDMPEDYKPTQLMDAEERKKAELDQRIKTSMAEMDRETAERNRVEKVAYEEKQRERAKWEAEQKRLKEIQDKYFSKSEEYSRWRAKIIDTELSKHLWKPGDVALDAYHQYLLSGKPEDYSRFQDLENQLYRDVQGLEETQKKRNAEAEVRRALKEKHSGNMRKAVTEELTPYGFKVASAETLKKWREANKGKLDKLDETANYGGWMDSSHVMLLITNPEAMPDYSKKTIKEKPNETYNHISLAAMKEYNQTGNRTVKIGGNDYDITNLSVILKTLGTSDITFTTASKDGPVIVKNKEGEVAMLAPCIGVEGVPGYNKDKEAKSLSAINRSQSDDKQLNQNKLAKSKARRESITRLVNYMHEKSGAEPVKSIFPYDYSGDKYATKEQQIDYLVKNFNGNKGEAHKIVEQVARAYWERDVIFPQNESPRVVYRRENPPDWYINGVGKELDEEAIKAY